MQFKANYICKTKDEKGWEHFAWIITINGVDFDYKTGIGHFTPHRMGKYGDQGFNKRPEHGLAVSNLNGWPHIPQRLDVLECLFSDARAGELSFADFCDDFGYSHGSISAFDAYRACMDTRTKLRKALGAEFAKIQEEIEAQQSA
jgi:hypothetical protein